MARSPTSGAIPAVDVGQRSVSQTTAAHPGGQCLNPVGGPAEPGQPRCRKFAANRSQSGERERQLPRRQRRSGGARRHQLDGAAAQQPGAPGNHHLQQQCQRRPGAAQLSRQPGRAGSNQCSERGVVNQPAVAATGEPSGSAGEAQQQRPVDGAELQRQHQHLLARLHQQLGGPAGARAAAAHQWRWRCGAVWQQRFGLPPVAGCHPAQPF